MEDNEIKLNGEEYIFSIDKDGGNIVIKVSDCHNVLMSTGERWYDYKVTGNEVSLIVRRNLSATEREGDILVYSSMYPDKYAYVAIKQKGETYSLSSDNKVKDNMSPLIDGEDFTFKLTAVGGDNRCHIKEIKEYGIFDDDEYVRIPFDKSIIAELEAVDNKGMYNLSVHNLGRITDDVYCFEIVVEHDNDHSTTLSFRLQYQDVSDAMTVSPSVLEFTHNGVSSDNIIHLKGNHIDSIEEHVSNNVEWVHLLYGYDCIYVYTDVNETNSNRTGNISIYGKQIEVRQMGKSLISENNLTDLSVEAVALKDYKETEYMDAIDNVTIDGNSISLRTNTFENDKGYVHNSMITVSITGKWADFSLDYDTTNELHIVKVIVETNPFNTDRKCIMTIKNAENTDYSQRFLLSQKSLSSELSIDKIID